MPRYRSKNKVLLALLWVSGVIWLISALVLLKQKKVENIETKELAQCELEAGFLGIEDFAALDDQGLLVLEADRFINKEGRKEPHKARISVWDGGRSVKSELKIDFGPLEEFYPLSLSVVSTSDGGWTVYVVNYRVERSFVEIFSLNREKTLLKHLKSIQSDLIQYPTSIHAYPDGSFHVVNQYGLYTPMGHMVEGFFELGTSYVTYCDPGGCQKSLRDLRNAKGIAFQGHQFALGEHAGKRLFSGIRVNGNLQIKDQKELGESIDYIKSDSNGNFWMVTHPDLISYNQFLMDPNAVHSVSRIYRFRLNNGKIENLQMIWSHRGETFSGAHVAMWHKQKLMIGSEFLNTAFVCPFPLDRLQSSEILTSH